MKPIYDLTGYLSFNPRISYDSELHKHRIPHDGILNTPPQKKKNKEKKKKQKKKPTQTKKNNTKRDTNMHIMKVPARVVPQGDLPSHN